jgi:nucleoside-diphosphate-sugar epimerase
MKVFAAGVTGAIGHPLTEQLVRAGHEVTGLTRSAEVDMRAAIEEESHLLGYVVEAGLL